MIVVSIDRRRGPTGKQKIGKLATDGQKTRVSDSAFSRRSRFISMGFRHGWIGIAVQRGAKSPGKDKESNWLPTPNGPFWLVLRTYGPGKSIEDKTYKVPSVKRVNE